MLYNIYTMTTPDEQRKLVALRMLASAHRQAKIAAVTEGKALGVWIEEAIREKVGRDGKAHPVRMEKLRAETSYEER